MMIHKPVLLEEVINNLNLKPGMTVVDGTLGAGGHSIGEFQKKVKKEGYEIRNRVSPAPVTNNANDENISPLAFVPLFSGDKIVGYWRGVNNNYANLDKIFELLGLNAADAILVDLGFSSDQIEDAERGFSFLQDGILDMRYSPETQKRTAADIVRKYSEKDLVDIFWKYGEERYARIIAKEIIKARKIEKIRGTGKLVEIISRAVPEKYKKGKIFPVKSRKAGAPSAQFNRVNPATRIFQALRIETNQELDNLRKFLEQATESLARKGRLAVISFHSLEDRIVKNYFRKESRDCVCPPKFPRCVCSHKKRLKIITKKP